MTLRTRLTLFYVGFFAAALLALGVGLYLLVRLALISSIDNELRLGAQLLQQGFSESNKSPLGYFNGDQLETILLRRPAVSGFEGTSLFVQVYEQQGELLAKSSNLNVPMEVNETLFQSVLAGQQPPIRTVSTDGIRGRELLVPLLFRNPVGKKDEIVGVAQVVRSIGETERALQLLLYALLAGGALAVLAAARGAIWLTHAAFRPIDEISHTAQSIVRAEDLSRRVPLPGAQDELQRLTVTVNDMLARMEGLFEAQRRFVADVSHELRTPLAAMQGNLEVLTRGAARDPQLLEESLADLRQEVARLIRMVNDLLFLAWSDTGFQMRREPFELDTLLLEVHRDLRPLAGAVQLRIGEEDQVMVLGDRDRLKQVLLNLGINALQHTGPQGSVTLNLSQQDGRAIVSVNDTGTGIPPEDLLHIFERFYRADQSRSRNYGGAGLGLAIVKGIVEAHGGRVTVESVPGQGSTFMIHLPVYQSGQLDQPESIEEGHLQIRKDFS